MRILKPISTFKKMAEFTTEEERKEQLEIENEFLRYKLEILKKQNQSLKKQVENLLKEENKKVQMLNLL